MLDFLTYNSKPVFHKIIPNTNLINVNKLKFIYFLIKFQQNKIKIIPNEEKSGKNTSMIQQKSTAIENELKFINKIKEKQKVELQTLLQHNLANYLRNKENEEKSKKFRANSLFNNTNTSNKNF